MTSPLDKLMAYGGTPINRQADRFMTHKNKWRRRGKKHIKILRHDSSWTQYSKLSISAPKPINPEPETSRDAESLKRICPICGIKKRGLEAHMAVKHAGVAVPKPTDQFMNQVFGKDQPTPSWIVAAAKAKPPKESPSAASDRRQTSKITGKKKRRCPICSAMFIRLPQHLTQAHGKVLADCPWCYAEVVVEVGGKRKCGECRKLFTVGAKGKAVGIRAECPDCCNDFYTEKLGRLKCPRCGGQNFFNGKGETC